MIVVGELIEKLRQFPADAEITLDVSGYDADGVSLSVGDTPVLEEEYGLCKLHFVTPPAIEGNFTVEK